MPDEHCVHPDVGAYALGLLEPDERARYELHLRGCARCSRAVRSLAPLVELLGAVDARSLLAATDPPAPPTPLRIPAPRLADSPVTPRPLPPAVEPAPPPRRGWHALRCVTIAAAASTVLVLVGFVTFAARSSVYEPPVAAGATTVESSPTSPAEPTPSRSQPNARPRPATSTDAPTTPPPATTRPPEPTTPPVEQEPSTLSAVGPPPASDTHVAHNPQTGAHATVETTAADTGTVRTDLTVAVTKIDGPREGVVTVTTTTGETTVATKWQIAEGGDGSTVWASAPVGAGEIVRVDVVDQAGTVLVSVPVNSR
ncbi:zf-HC2 domain-containing protein [Micromonospora sp. CPCC 206061]|uniref:zf-HC2 domain-containing protein n=1 Tax=Micromonospora sp. CPCC 206061 TaxID=3122410 RepID=UPI002FEF9E5D